MKLYILRPINPDTDSSPWVPWYEKAFGFVVRAESEEAAREIADAYAGDENTRWVNYSNKTALESIHPWLSSKDSSCDVLANEGPKGLVVRDFARA